MRVADAKSGVRVKAKDRNGVLREGVITAQTLSYRRVPGRYRISKRGSTCVWVTFSDRQGDFGLFRPRECTMVES